MPMFDTHKYVKTLMATGFTQDQAEAMATGQLQLLEVVATKDDLVLLEHRLLIKTGVLNAALAGLLFAALRAVQ